MGYVGCSGVQVGVCFRSRVVVGVSRLNGCDGSPEAIVKLGVPGADVAVGQGHIQQPERRAFSQRSSPWLADTSDSGHRKNVILVKFNTGGDLVWQKVGGPGFGTGSDVAVSP